MNTNFTKKFKKIFLMFSTLTLIIMFNIVTTWAIERTVVRWDEISGIKLGKIRDIYGTIILTKNPQGEYLFFAVDMDSHIIGNQSGYKGPEGYIDALAALHGENEKIDFYDGDIQDKIDDAAKDIEENEKQAKYDAEHPWHNSNNSILNIKNSNTQEDTSNIGSSNTGSSKVSNTNKKTKNNAKKNTLKEGAISPKEEPTSNIITNQTVAQNKTDNNTIQAHLITWTNDPTTGKFKLTYKDASGKSVDAVNGFYNVVTTINNQNAQTGKNTSTTITDTYYFNSNGEMQTGWITSADGKKYFFDNEKTANEGAMCKGSKIIENVTYLFNEDGSLKDNVNTSNVVNNAQNLKASINTQKQAANVSFNVGETKTFNGHTWERQGAGWTDIDSDDDVYLSDEAFCTKFNIQPQESTGTYLNANELSLWNSAMIAQMAAQQVEMTKNTVPVNDQASNPNTQDGSKVEANGRTVAENNELIAAYKRAGFSDAEAEEIVARNKPEYQFHPGDGHNGGMAWGSQDCVPISDDSHAYILE